MTFDSHESSSLSEAKGGKREQTHFSCAGEIASVPFLAFLVPFLVRFGFGIGSGLEVAFHSRAPPQIGAGKELIPGLSLSRNFLLGFHREPEPNNCHQDRAGDVKNARRGWGPLIVIRDWRDQRHDASQ